MKRAALLVFAAATLAASLGVGRAQAAAAPPTNECRGFMACVSVPGPWVSIAPRTGASSSWDLQCPRRFIVGGIDALVSDRSVDVAFLGNVGGPVSPGVATTTDAVVIGRYAGRASRYTSFRPFIGCIPTSGGGGRETTAYQAQRAIFPVGQPVIRRVSTVHLRPRLEGEFRPRCLPNERLIATSAAAGFWTTVPPTAAMAAAVRVTVRETTVVVSTGSAFPPTTRADAQSIALCAGG